MQSSLQGRGAGRQIQNLPGLFQVCAGHSSKAGGWLSEACYLAFSAPTPATSTGSLLMRQSRDIGLISLRT